ncbi:MAG: autotransporter-associated beta strand repeat-containing protein [Luteolibacter sp.]
MPPPPYGKLPGLLLSASLLLVKPAHAASGSWTNAAGGSWSTTTNWAFGFTAGGTGANAGFSSVNLTNDATVTLDGAKTVGKLVFSDTNPSHNWFLTIGSGGSLTLDVDSGIPSITVSNQTATLAVSIAGSKGFSKEGVGTLILSGSNVYSGGTILNAGTLQISGANSLKGPTTINSGTTLWLNAGGAAYSSALSGTGTVRVSAGTGAAQLQGDLSGFGGKLDIPAAGVAGKVLFTNITQAESITSAATVSVQSGSTLFLGPTDTAVSFGANLELSGAGNSENLGALRIERGASWSGPVTLKASTFIGSQTGAGTISGSIGDGGGNFGFTKQGTGTLVLAGENTYNGTTVHNGAGVLAIGNPLALRNSTLAYTGGGLVFDQSVDSHSYTFGSLSGTADIVLNNNAETPVSIYLTVGGNNAGATYSGNLSGEGSFEKSGTGVMTISGANTYAGSTTVSKGTLRLSVPPVLPANLKIMPLGDSITYGFNGGNAGYRGLLYNLLNSIASGFRYIGTSIERPGSLPVSPIDQRHNEGHSSYAINDISNNLDGFDNSKFLQYGGPERNPNGGHWFDGIPNVRDPMYPDVITLMIGTNDIVDLTGVQTRLHNLLSKITTQRPAAKLIVATITPLPAFTANVTAYNGIIASEVAAFQSVGKQVFLVDMKTGFPANGLDPDNIHPNDIGFTFMASQWRDAILSAFATQGGPVPDQSPTWVGSGAILDLNGTTETVGSLSGGGQVLLGTGGVLVTNNLDDTTFSGTVSGSGRVVKNGSGVLTLSGAFTQSGKTQVNKGTLRVTGSISSTDMIEILPGATLILDGGTLTVGSIHIYPGGTLEGDGTIHGVVLNDGGITSTIGQSLAFTGGVTNNGIVRMSGGALLQASQDFFNRGTLDLITAAPVAVQNLVNTGSILDSSLVRVDSFVKSGDSVTLTIQSYSGHRYQLQCSATLLSDSWQNVGESKVGVTGSVLSFQASVVAAEAGCFYRIRVTP